jgi:hypothetical protein
MAKPPSGGYDSVRCGEVRWGGVWYGSVRSGKVRLKQS